MTLKNELQQIRLSLEDQLKPTEIAAIDRAIQELSASGAEARALQAGEKAPEFAFEQPDGSLLRSTDLLARGPVVLSFQRGSWCPFCATELQFLERHADRMRALGASVLAVTPEPLERSVAFAKGLHVRFPVLSDEHNAVARRFRLELEHSDPLRDLFFAFGPDAERFARVELPELPIPATYVIDPSGLVRYAFARTDYHLRAEPAVLLEELRKI